MDLAKESEFELGGLRIRPGLRQVDSAAGSETLEPRIMQVLVALARQRGDVVSRDQLIEQCWDGLAVGDDSISRCIYRLRKLGESSGAFRLETITRVGYRLVASTAEPAEDRIWPAGKPDATSTPSTQPAALSWARKRIAGAAIAGAAFLLVAATVLVRGSGPPDVDQVVARLSERLQDERVLKPGEAARARDAVRELGASARPEELSAFAALASDDGEHALDILEELARQLEASGDLEAASRAYRRVGTIAVLFDDARAVYSQRKAFELFPDSLASFQSLFFITFLQDSTDTSDLVDKVLAQPGLSDRMRGWVLAHRGYVEAETRDVEQVNRTLAEMRALREFQSDPVLQISATWVEATTAFATGDMPLAQSLAEQVSERWRQIPERTSNSGEILLFRVLYERGDWRGAFETGSEMFERRSKELDLLPSMVGWTLCEAGAWTGQARKALPYCVSSVRRGEGHPSRLKAQAAMASAIEGDFAMAGRNMDMARSLAPEGARLMKSSNLLYEAWIAAFSGDIARADALLTLQPEASSWEEATKSRPAMLAMKHRLHGEWLVSAGQPSRACDPLAEAERVYRGYGGDAGRDAVRAVRAAAGCSPA